MKSGLDAAGPNCCPDFTTVFSSEQFGMSLPGMSGATRTITPKRLTTASKLSAGNGRSSAKATSNCVFRTPPWVADRLAAGGSAENTFLAHELLVKTLCLPPDAYFSRIASGNEDEITNCESETHWPPNGGQQQCAAASSDGVGGQRIFRCERRVKHHGEKSRGSNYQHTDKESIRMQYMLNPLHS